MSPIIPTRESWRALQESGADLLLWIIAAGLGIASVFAIQRTRLGADPRIWLAQFLEPLITLPILTRVLRWRGETWSSLGLRKPNDWSRFLGQVAIGLLAMLSVAYLIRHLVIAPLHLRSSYLPGLQNNVSTLARLIIFALFGVGLNEELQFRGFVQSRFEQAFGARTTGRYASVVITGLIFGFAHLAWGPANIVYAGLLGMTLGGMYLWADRNLWVPVILHSLFDVFRAAQFFLYGNDLPS